ncbi:MAG TPA: SUMF1/EgtB/PvdO family nonheme iron enzyme, partial [Polyangiaceae bacterium]|nr:SUMF1/EgtB/PvdO family nonheme iron enzyme [Polyangiaceae bacterium]
MALVPAQLPFCVDRWEAALVRELDDGSLEMHAFTARPRRGERYRAVSRPGVSPQAYINRVEASAACEAAGKRLCTRTEWQRACRRDGRAVYPYGDARDPGAC